MNMRLILQWTAMASTAVLMVLLKKLHLGVLHYNWFLVILLAWSLGLLLLFRALAPGESAQPGPAG